MISLVNSMKHLSKQKIVIMGLFSQNTEEERILPNLFLKGQYNKNEKGFIIKYVI